MTQPAIVVKDLAKRYEIDGARRRNDTLRDELIDTCRAYLRRRRDRDERRSFWALRRLSFEIQHGEVVGIIGSNGAGKSTLLKILSRITTPTAGFADIYGRVGSLLEVGTGFHPDLTGRENIFLNGAILGMKRVEIERKFDEMVAFAEVEKFLDTPVKRYSSGMQIRLAFAVAAHLEPEILLIDEVLAVGDVNFQKKCLGKMEHVAREGRTVLFVSHNLAAVEHLCHKGIVLRQGEEVFQGPAKEAISYYLTHVAGPGDAAADPSDLSNAPGRSSKYRPHLRSLELLSDGDQPLNGTIRMGAPFRARIRCDVPGAAKVDAAIGFDSLLGQRVFTAHTWFEPDFDGAQPSGERTFVCDIPSLKFTPGEYKILVALAVGGLPIDVVEDAARLDVIDADYYGTGRVPWNGLVVMDHHWRLD